MRPLLSREVGQSIVEFALALPIIIALLVLAVDASRAYYYGIAVIDAAAAGARQASQTPTDDTSIKSAATQAAPSGALSSGDVTISGARTSGSAMTVTVSYTFTPITPFARNILPTLAISRAATVRVR